MLFPIARTNFIPRRFSALQKKRPNYLFTLFMLLLAGGGVLIVFRQMSLLTSLQQTLSTTPDDDLKAQLKAICNDTSIQAVNQFGMRMEGFGNGVLNPISCRNDDSTQSCETDLAITRKWRSDGNQEVKQIFVESLNKFNIEAVYAAGVVAALGRRQINQLKTLEQKHKLSVITKTMYSAFYASALANLTSEIGVGDCREQTYRSADKLLQLPVKLKLQFVELKYNDGESLHIYALINGNLPDIEIFNDQAAVEAYLANLQQGYICDTWNKGYFSEVITNDLNLYKRGWNGLSVISVSRDIDMSDFPVETTRDIQQQMQKLGIYQQFEKTPGLLFFDKKALTAEGVVNRSYDSGRIRLAPS